LTGGDEVKSDPHGGLNRGWRLSDTPLLALGETHTALLHSSLPLTLVAAERLVGLDRGERVRVSQRPIAHVASTAVLTGVDCRLPTRTGAKAHGVGTVAGRVSITGGHVLQASARIGLAASSQPYRRAWSHYLARPGCVELIGKADLTDLADGFIAEARHPDVLDLGSVGARLILGVQRSSDLDHRAPLKAARAKLRWAARPALDPDLVGARFTIERNGLRTLVVWCDPADLDAVGDFCDDVALHDWLLTTLLHMIEDGHGGAPEDRALVERLRPVVTHLLHLWMPEARLTPTVAQLWRSLDVRPGFTRQWRSSVDRIRDQLTLSTLALFGR
jgi:hypothetical protein